MRKKTSAIIEVINDPSQLICSQIEKFQSLKTRLKSCLPECALVCQVMCGGLHSRHSSGNWCLVPSPASSHILSFVFQENEETSLDLSPFIYRKNSMRQKQSQLQSQSGSSMTLCDKTPKPWNSLGSWGLSWKTKAGRTKNRFESTRMNRKVYKVCRNWRKRR